MYMETGNSYVGRETYVYWSLFNSNNKNSNGTKCFKLVINIATILNFLLFKFQGHCRGIQEV